MCRPRPGQQYELNALLDQSARARYPLRVAIVASPGDLGSVSALWRQPASYARFLGGELSLVFHGTVLVVMPNGYGIDVTAAAGTRTATGETELPLPGARLGRAAIAAVQRLATSAGAPHSAHVALPQTVARPASSLPWLVFVLGFVPLAGAWIRSLRRRPFRFRS